MSRVSIALALMLAVAVSANAADVTIRYAPPQASLVPVALPSQGAPTGVAELPVYASLGVLVTLPIGPLDYSIGAHWLTLSRSYGCAYEARGSVYSWRCDKPSRWSESSGVMAMVAAGKNVGLGELRLRMAGGITLARLTVTTEGLTYQGSAIGPLLSLAVERPFAAGRAVRGSVGVEWAWAPTSATFGSVTTPISFPMFMVSLGLSL